MPRRFVNQLADQEAIDQVFLASEKQLRPNRNGNLYLQVQLSDRTGVISARMWNATDEHYRSFENGEFIRVVGNTQVYQGGLQVIATKLYRVSNGEIDATDFRRLTETDVARLEASLGATLATVTHPDLKAVVEAFLSDAAFLDAFRRAPAGIKLHHAHDGGLLEHVVSLLTLADKVAHCYPDVHRDLLLLGVFLHDAGKIEELGFQRDFHYTDAGQLLGHVVLGLKLLDDKLPQVAARLGRPFAADMELRLKHMILSHHGHYEFGSPKLPMTLEALVLHSLDHLDAKIAEFSQVMRDDLNSESNWTPFQPQIARKLYKSLATRSVLPERNPKVGSEENGS